MHPSSRHGKFFFLAICLVALTLPHLSEEFGLFGGNDKSDVEDRKNAPKSAADKKHKFHKLKKVDLAEYEPDDNDEEDENDVGGNDDEGDDDQDEDNDSENDENNDDDGSEEKSKKKKSQSIFKMILDEEEREEAEEAKRESDGDDSGGFFSFSWIWGSEEKKEKDSNGIINWIKSWRSSSDDGDDDEAPPPPKSEGGGWLGYLNRWPFNVLVPFGKTKKIRLPKCDGAPADSGAEPLSEEHFESLLHTMPGFVVNVAKVSDPECKQQLKVFHHQLRGNKLWPIQMIDSSGKMTSGMLHGNINQLGDFESCTGIRTIVKVTKDLPVKVKGKYCLAHIEFRAKEDGLRFPIHLAHGRGLWNSHLGNPSNFIPRYSVASWGICIPHMCSSEDVQEMFEENLGPYNSTGVTFRTEVDENECYVKSSKSLFRKFKKDQKLLFTLCFFATFVIAVASNFMVEHWEKITEFTLKFIEILKIAYVFISEFIISLIPKKEESTEEKPEGEGGDEDVKEAVDQEEEVVSEESTKEEETKEEETKEEEEAKEEAVEEVDEFAPPPIKDVIKNIWLSFSPERSYQELISTEKKDMQFPFFHLIRIVSTIMLYFFLKFVMIGHYAISNRDEMASMFNNSLTVFFRTPMIFMDLLLIVSGFLTSYQLSEEMQDTNHIGLLKRLTYKGMRYLPTLYAVLFFQTWILPYFGSGPFWGSLIMQNSEICESQMWRNIFSVQNAIDFEETCSPISVQLALEMQLFFIAPLIVWLYYSDSNTGFYVYGALHAMSVAARFGRTDTEHLSSTLFHGINVSKFYRTANLMFSSPVSRVTPYLVGVGTGILYRNTEGVIEMSPSTVRLNWIMATLGISWCFWNPSSGMNMDFIYDSSDAASYASWSPLILGMSIALIIFLLPKNGDSEEPHPFNKFCTSLPALVISRMCYPIQLVTFVVILYNTASSKEIRKYSFSDMFDIVEIFSILFFAVLLSVLIDIPMRNVRSVIVERLFWPKPPQADEEEHDISSGEDMSEHSGTESKPKTPEPSDDIWGSDPEEAEEKYLARRKSSLGSLNEGQDE
ncbi:hypothetical protein ACFFRR_002871, partial [Megaselia abdita]